MNSIEKAAKAIYGNKSFAVNFAPYEPEFFPIEKSVQVRDVYEKYSEFECDELIAKFDWFRNLSKFQIKKAKVDITQTPGYEILLKGNPVGFIEKRSSNRYRIGFCIESDNEDGFAWKYFRKSFDSVDEARLYISTYYGIIQQNFKFYIEKTEEEPLQESIGDLDDDF